jgi:large subunit ribosomal protein L17e
VNKVPKIADEPTELMAGLTHTWAPPATLTSSLTEKEQIVPKPEEEAAQKKKIS